MEEKSQIYAPWHLADVAPGSCPFPPMMVYSNSSRRRAFASSVFACQAYDSGARWKGQQIVPSEVPRAW
jgi:hypothetical protein